MYYVWTLDFSWTTSNETTLVRFYVYLSVRPSVTKFSQDRIISFLIFYMIADHAILWLTKPDFF